MGLQNKPAQLLEKVQGDGNLWKKKSQKMSFFSVLMDMNPYIFFMSVKTNL